MRQGAYSGVLESLSGARFLRLLADDTRLRILTLLLRTPDLCVCEFVAVLRLPQYRISRHLGQLRRSGLLTSRREGPFVFYAIAPVARRHPLRSALLRSIPHLAGRAAASGDLGRMRRLMRLEGRGAGDGCAATSAPRLVRGRPILRVLSTT
ncbi:MAG: helix-turn-helix transcriptional regulator [Candidatus Rokubacteria bacterium]|nr:helix-turn-helix transcriptional regulator [Candidatus Rokubacteria bacterium]